jgi:hypothetical protein
VPRDTGDAAAAGAVVFWLGCAAAEAGPELVPGDGPIVGNRAAALPGPMSKLAAPFRAGMGPSGSTATCVALGEALALADFAGAAAVTAVVSAAAGGVHFCVVTTLAVAVSFTELTDVAFAATAIWAFRLAACAAATALMVHEAVPSPLEQPLVKAGFWLDGCAVSATDTFEAVAFWVETCTT